MRENTQEEKDRAYLGKYLVARGYHYAGDCPDCGYPLVTHDERQTPSRTTCINYGGCENAPG